MNISKESSGLDDESLCEQYTSKICNVLYNFMDNCEVESMCYPIRTL